ncbi:uncharacterized protein EV154DRAFT_321265 [Mucor mucedo]|uniref:uncharacterized protein n=1 Tax=Mucor mucedo TaxID=29922 RepID=UPI00221EAE8D|nr:uncharacterized protein EV154DRAFT_321265 [Mucor mucedo]KAI7888198.1 hypothetical protein EV154DRAFT_321265 [Mucor mucedo]
MRLLSLIIASFLVTFASALKLQGKIIPNSIISDVSKIDSSTTRVVLNGNQHTAHIKVNGEFTFPDVKEGSYLLEVQSIEHIFPKLRVDINNEDKVRASYTAFGVDWNQRGVSVEYPLEIQAKQESEYFMERQGFNVMGMFKNPMFLMLGVSAVMMFFMPKLMKTIKDMDPEAMEEMSQTQTDAQKMLNDMPGLSQMFAKK